MRSTPATGQVVNDLCASALPATEGSYQASNVGATTDGDASCGLLGDTGGQDVWWEYSPSAGGTATIDTCGSNFDTILSVHAGCGGTELACNDDQLQGGCGSTLPVTRSRVDFSVEAGVTYLVRVAGWGTRTGNISLQIALTPEGPYCGDAVCNGEEDPCSCPQDGCKAACGDGCCSEGECPGECPEDCDSLEGFAEFQVCFSGHFLASGDCFDYDTDGNLSVNIADYSRYIQRRWPDNGKDCD